MSNTHRKARIQAGGVIRTVYFIEKSALNTFIKMLLMAILLIASICISYYAGVSLGTKGTHTSFFEGLKDDNTFDLDALWITIMKFDHNLEKTSNSSPQRMRNILNNVLKNCKMASDKVDYFYALDYKELKNTTLATFSTLDDILKEECSENK